MVNDLNRFAAILLDLYEAKRHWLFVTASLSGQMSIEMLVDEIGIRDEDVIYKMLCEAETGHSIISFAAIPRAVLAAKKLEEAFARLRADLPTRPANLSFADAIIVEHDEAAYQDMVAKFKSLLLFAAIEKHAWPNRG